MKEQPIIVFAKWRVKQGSLDTVLNLLKEAGASSRAEEGNLFYTVHQSTTEPNSLILHEGYTNEEAMAIHRSSAHFQEVVVGQIVPLLEEREINITTQLD